MVKLSKKTKGRMLIWLGVVLILIGAVTWIAVSGYTMIDFVTVIVGVAVAVWLYGDYLAGALW